MSKRPWEDVPSASDRSKRPLLEPESSLAWTEVADSLDHFSTFLDVENLEIGPSEVFCEPNSAQEPYGATPFSSVEESLGRPRQACAPWPIDSNGGDGLESTPHSIVCMGMIPQIHCQRLVKGKVASCVQSHFLPDQQFLRLQCQTGKGRVILGTEQAPRLVQANAKTAAVISEICGLPDVFATFYVSRQSLLKFLEQDSSDPKATKRLEVEANIYGSQPVCADVGTLLQDKDIFLQDPTWCDNDLPYENPHLLQLENVDDIEVWCQALLLDTEQQTSQGTDWGAALDDLYFYPEQTNEAATADREPHEVLKTALLEHQVQARKFMSSRESGNLPSEQRFWQFDRNEGESAVYRHAITSEECNYPQPEPLGGILADEMGMGKTLSTISLIVTSLDRAQRFVEYSTTGTSQSPPLTFTKATLVVVPSTLLMDGWIKEFKKHVAHDTLSIGIYHHRDRARSFKELLQYDIVLTTYGTVSTEYRRPQRRVLYYLKWFRIVLDEAHTIRSRSTQQFKAVAMLDARHYWCVTGTPIQNRIEDLGSLLAFCRVPQLQDPKIFQQYLAKQYDEIFRKHRSAMNDVVSGKMHATKRLTPLDLLLRLRIFCNQGTFTQLNEEGQVPDLDADETFTLLEEQDSACCEVCFSGIKSINQLEDSESGVIGECSHVLCRICFPDGLKDANDTYSCPVCNQVTKLQAISPRATGFRHLQQPRHSTKLESLIQDLLLTKDYEKSIVFSQWRKTLDIVSQLCTTHSIFHVSIDGSTPQAERISMLERFANDPTISVILMTMGTGAQGLNITAACRIHILEPQWNPAAEAQAVGRAVRIGQQKRATVIRYIVEESVDVYIQAKQRKKTELASGGWSEM